jgi:hypothetical protein
MPIVENNKSFLQHSLAGAVPAIRLRCCVKHFGPESLRDYRAKRVLARREFAVCWWDEIDTGSRVLAIPRLKGNMPGLNVGI